MPRVKDSSRVVLITARGFPSAQHAARNGGAINGWAVVRALLRAGLKVDIFSRAESEHREEVRRGRLRVFRIPYRPARGRNSLARTLAEGQSFTRELCKHPAFDLSSCRCLLTHHWGSTIGLPRLLDQGLRWIHTPHLLAIEKARHLRIACPAEVRREEAAVIARATRVIALSRDEKQAMVDSYSIAPRRVRVIPNGVSAMFFRVGRRRRRPGAAVRIGVVGRLCPQKGYDILLQALQRIQTRAGPVLELHVWGDDDGESRFVSDLRVRARRFAGHMHIVFHGPIAHERLPVALSKIDIYAQPSRYESQGIALLEAMAAQRAIIASDVAAIREYVVPGLNGLLVPARDPVTLAEALAKLAASAPLRDKLALAARKTAKRFTWHATVASTLDCILE